MDLAVGVDFPYLPPEQQPRAVETRFASWETHMRIAALTALVGTLCVAACDDSNNVVIPVSNVNTFILQTVNGRALPVTIADSIAPPRRIDVLSGSITLGTPTNVANGFTDVTMFRQTLDTVVTTPTVTCTGTFSRVGNAFTFVESVSSPNCGRTFTGNLSGDSLSASILGIPAVFTR